MSLPAAEAHDAPHHILLVMLDGIGLPPEELENSVYAGCPTLISLFRNHAVPVDARLNTPGVPQSATGQTSILTGVNAPELMGEHIQGFPVARLRTIIENDNVFLRALAAGKTAVFANAYARCPGKHLPLKHRSATTVATLAAFGETRNLPELLRGEAVFHDLTRHTLRERYGNTVPPVTETEAANHLLQVLRSVDFCLFEFFLSDWAGHRGTLVEKKKVLRSLDLFVEHLLLSMKRESELLLMVSDHGNIEDTEHRGHTANPVPWIAFGCGAERARRGMCSIHQVTPRIVELLKNQQESQD